MLLGMVRPTAGASYLNGEKLDGGNYRIWNRVGYIVEIPYAYPELTVRENLGIIHNGSLIQELDVGQL
jgi:ABC-2 type transport system ATP-binding protein